jgi:hypothetical protein
MATRLESPVDGVIVGVQVLWESPNGDAPPVQQPAIELRALNGANPYTPGASLATIQSPTLEDVGVNEYRFLDPGTNSVPLAVPVAAGTQFWVDLEITPSEADGPSMPGLLLDADGTQGVNSGFILGNNIWVPFTIAIAGGGDLGLRAIIQPVPEPSTCALAVFSVIALLTVGRRSSKRK